MNDNNNNNKSKTAILTLLCILFGATILILLKKGYDKEQILGSISNTYEEKISEIKYETDLIKADRDILAQVVMDDEKQKDSIIDATKNELSAYKEKSRKERNDLIKKFQKSIVVSETGHEATLDTTAIDSINKYVIDCEGKKKALVKADTIIAGQKRVTEKDSAQLVKAEEKFKIADEEAKKQASEAAYNKYAMKFWRGFSAGMAVFHVALITAILTK